MLGRITLADDAESDRSIACSYQLSFRSGLASKDGKVLQVSNPQDFSCLGNTRLSCATTRCTVRSISGEGLTQRGAV